MAAEKSSHGSKNLIIVIFLIIAVAAGYGYFNQSAELRDDGATTGTTGMAEEKTEADKPKEVKLPPASAPVFSARPDDIVIGSAAAPMIILEYASLSCPHCAHFEEEVFPKLNKEYIKTGKARLIYRHFPLNEPAMRAAQLVECIGGAQRKVVVSSLFASQKDWAFDAKFVENLKKTATLNGVDAAKFSSCMSDKKIEDRILGVRTEAAQVLGVEHTPALFVNGTPYQGEATIEGLRKALGK